MALFHLSVTQTKRSAGQSAIASAAYRAGERLYSEYYGEYSDYTRKGGVICSDILLPSHAPPEYADRQTLWNAVEKAERGKNAQLAYSFDIALQNEFSLEENIALARQFLLEQFVSRGMVVDFAVHQPDKEDGGILNPHFHVLCPIRPIEQNGKWGLKQHRVYELDEDGNRIRDQNGEYVFSAVSTTDWGSPETLEHWRQTWAELCNAKFAEKGLDVRIDHRSYERQGVDLLPTVHEGATVRAMEKKGIRTEKGEFNRWIKATNAVIRDIKKKISLLFDWIAEAKAELATYPRTDSRYLTNEMEDTTNRLACLMKEKWGYTKLVPLNTKSVLNSSKVSDHHAILPTENVFDAVFGDLPAGEQKILTLLAARLISALGNPSRFTEYHLELTAAGQTFKASAKRVTDPGWKEVESWILGKRAEESMESSEEEGKQAKDPDEDPEASGNEGSKILAALSADPGYFAEGKSMKIMDAQLREGTTKPKPRFTESSLLSAMERAGASETPDEAERKGLGTPATRAGIIEKLVRIGFVERKGERKTKYLIPTHKGISLVTVMPEEIRSPLLTADWEQKLLKVEKQELAPEDFMKEIGAMISTLVSTYEAVQDAEVMKREPALRIGTCPACGSDIVERQKGYFCSNRDCHFALWKENRYFDAIGKKLTKEIVKSLLESGRANLTKCRSRKSGRTYDASICMTTGTDGKPAFRMEFPDRKGAKRK